MSQTDLIPSNEKSFDQIPTLTLDTGLIEYLEHRRGFLDILEIEPVQVGVPVEPPDGTAFDTVLFIDRLESIGQSSLGAQEIQRPLANLIQKFAVFGRVFRHYDHRFKKVESYELELEHYAKLSLCLQRSFRVLNRYNLLNSAIKINEFLISRTNHENGLYRGSVPIKKAIEGELEIIGRISGH